jgi:hypothetical protein
LPVVTVQPVPTEQAIRVAEAQQAVVPAERPRRLVVFAVAFAALYAFFVVRDRMLFTMAIDERGDPAANSIITYQAKHFHLLVGNYSRLGFWHPGPAFFYVQAFGEWFWHDLLGAVPSPWNGQVLALLALNAALIAAALAVLAGWSRSWPAVGLAAAVALGVLAAHGQLVATPWTPYLCFAPFLLLLVAGASVAAGRTRDLWALVLGGGFLVHGHAQFLLFVPVIAGAVLVALAVRLRRRYFADRRGWLLGLGVLALFLLPIVLNLVLHWPGEFEKYATYGSSRQVGARTLAEALGFTLRFWPGRGLGMAAGVVLLAAAVLLGRGRPAGPFVRAGAGLAVLATALLTGYAWHGIDDLGESYLGYFSYAVPVLVGILAVVTLVDVVTWPVLRRSLAIAALAAAVIAASLAPTLVTPREPLVDAPAAISALRARAGGRPVVLDVQHEVWPQMVGLVMAGQRRGQRICTRDRSWAFMLTDEFVCHGADLADGEPFLLGASGSAPSGPSGTVVASLGSAVLSTPATGG